MTFLQALMNLETGNENVSENHSECIASIEKGQALKITRYDLDFLYSNFTINLLELILVYFL